MNLKSEHGVFFNDGLYWRASIKMQGGHVKRIIAFDLGSEKYHQIPPPPAHSGSETPVDQYLDASGGCLFVSYSYEEEPFIIWMLKNQGGKSIWNKFVSLELDNVGIILEHPRFISYSKSKNLVVVHNEDNLLWYDVETKCVTKVSITGVEGSFSCQAFPICQLNGTSNAKETTASKGSLKRKRTVSKDSLTLKLKALTFQTPSIAWD